MQNTTGRFLVASPYLPDDNFQRTVVYMVRHDDEGAFGLVLTRPSDLCLQEVLQSTMGMLSSRNDPVYLGGPVEGPLCALHDDGNLADLDCADGLYVTSEQESIVVLANSSATQVRFFAGYSGWGAGQLEDELRQGGWLITDASAEDIFSDCNPLWETLVKRIGHAVIGQAVPSANRVDSQLN